ncbi:hypothetical protein DFJ73DRAFT_354930 [Zopfochytrium polystomum]|nr:hypothetical protein DFJ73DRAFT_354930 [Zopfochytrium polystomum]
MLKPNEEAWKREEALADVVSSVFVDLPEAQMLSLEVDELGEPLELTESLNPVSRYIQRWKTHFVKAKSFISNVPAFVLNLQKELTSQKSPAGGSTNSSILLVQDKLGFRKLAVLASSSGKISALETEDGRLAWTRWIGPAHVRSVEVVRASNVKFPPLIAVVTETAADTTFTTINAITGEDYGSTPSQTISGKFSQVVKLPVREKDEHTEVIALVAGTERIRLFPSTSAAADAFALVKDSFFFYETAVGASGITGFASGNLVKDKTGFYYPVRKTWTIDFPVDEKVAALASRSSSAEAHPSLGRVLGNRSVYYKYLNPNVIAIATLLENTRAGTSNVNLYLIDSVTGAIFHRSSYLGAGHAARGLNSIHLLQVDNSVILSYFNHGPDAAELITQLVSEAGTADTTEEVGKKKRRRSQKRKDIANNAPDVKGYEIVALEIYENERPDKRMEGNTYTSFSAKRPQVLSQSFVFPNTITAVGVTSTTAGITTREFLFGLTSNQLLGINRRLLDPRRPQGAMSNDDKEEMLIPYRSVIDYNPRDVASYYLQVMGIERIITSPTLLESTSLVLAHGVDLFFVRRAPSKTFDVLSEDFNYIALISTIALLLVGIEVAKYFAQRKRLFDQWM